MFTALKERSRLLACLLIVLGGSAGCGSGVDTREQNTSGNSELASTGQYRAPDVDAELGKPFLSVGEAAAIRIDATALSNPGFGMDDLPWYPRDTIQTVTLMPGTHDFYTKVGALGLTHIYFTITSAGTVDYTPENEGVFGGRGTSTLVVRGRTVRVDATALSNPGFGMDDLPWYPRDTIQTVTLMPGTHDFYTKVGALGLTHIYFTITPAGTVDYTPENEGVFGGRGTSTLVVRGRTVRVDATALSNPGFGMDDLPWYPRDTIQTVTLMPGTHDFYTKVGALGLTHIYFTITSAGTVDYTPENEGVFGGRGTSTLVVRGRTVRVDATALSNPGFGMDDLPWYPRDTIQTVTLMPGTHDLYTKVGALGLTHIYFTITSAGTVDYTPENEGVFGGRGTSTLIVRGRTVRVDATALSNPGFGMDDLPWYPRDTIQTVTLMPGTHDLYTKVGALGLTHIYFTITPAGTVDYTPENEGVFGGRGTSTLVVRGRTVRVDATALSNSGFGMDDLPWYSQETVLTVTLLPGQHDFYTTSNSAGLNHTIFLVKSDRTIDYDPTLNGMLAGRGTSTLLIRGAVILIDARHVSDGQLNVDASGWLTTDSMVPYALMPGRHELLISVSGATSILYFEISKDGTVNYSPDKEGTVFSGHGTSILLVLNTAPSTKEAGLWQLRLGVDAM